jgi:MinD-like ATPase involved in chromosome partitioning or flagellar assembly
LINFKGGTGKTVLTGNVAAIAAKLYGWKVVVIDLDDTISITQLALGGAKKKYTLVDAFEFVQQGRNVGDAICYAERYGFWLMPGATNWKSKENLKNIPHLIHNIKNSYFQGGHVDLVIIDPPGGDRDVNLSIMLGVDLVAVPLGLSATDVASTFTTLSFLSQLHAKTSGRPEMLGLIPNQVSRKGTYDKGYLEFVMEQGSLLPYLPQSNVIKGSYSKANKDGKEVPIYYAPKAPATKRLIKLVHALNNPSAARKEATKEIAEYLGLDVDVLIKKNEPILEGE